MPRIYISSSQQDSFFSPVAGSSKTWSLKPSSMNPEIAHSDINKSGAVHILVLAMLLLLAFRWIYIKRGKIINTGLTNIQLN